jgi:enoyl-CoA hydratase
MSQQTRVEIKDGIAWITMDDGKVNALSRAMLGEIGAALEAAERAGAVSVLSGRAGIFSAGFDLRSFERGAEASVEMVLAGAQLIERLLVHPLPVLTVCTGHAYPMGAFLMLSADVRFGVAGDFRIGMNEVAIGMTIPRFAIELARHRLTPPGFARVPTAAMFAPEEALRLGYLDRVLDADQLADAVQAEASRLRALDMPSFAATKLRSNQRVLQAVRAATLEDFRSSVEIPPPAASASTRRGRP